MGERNSIDGALQVDTVVRASGPASPTRRAGQMLRIATLEIRQAGDFLPCSAYDFEDRYAATDTMKINRGGIPLSTGTVPYRIRRKSVFSIVADSCEMPDPIGGGYSAAVNSFRYGVGYQTNCSDNFPQEAGEYGMGPRDLTPDVNFFMHVPAGTDGKMDVGPGISKVDDYVDLRAEVDVLAMVSNCAQINNSVDDSTPLSIRVTVWSLN